jgi:large exoprotein involved in heme utilization and adhesion
LAQSDFGAEGKSGNINIETNRLNISDGSKIQAATFGNGNAGDIIIRASKIKVFNNPNANNFFSTTINAGVSIDPRNVNPPEGDGGNLTIKANQLNVENGADVSANTEGKGDAGNLSINVQNLIVNGSQVSASTFGEGNAGDLIVNASNSVELSGETPFDAPGGLFAQVNAQGQGNGGNLTIDTKILSVSDGSKVQVSTFGLGNAGKRMVG